MNSLRSCGFKKYGDTIPTMLRFFFKSKGRVEILEPSTKFKYMEISV